MDKQKLLAFMRSHRLGVESSVTPSGGSQSAVVGFAVTDDFHIVFDTIDTTRKVRNLRSNPRLSFVIGGLAGGDERTVQYEGIADEPSGSELDALKAVYFKTFPEGPERQSWPGICYVRIRPAWIRYSDFEADPPERVEFSAEQLTETRGRSKT
jgi:general stress protein 26